MSVPEGPWRGASWDAQGASRDVRGTSEDAYRPDAPDVPEGDVRPPQRGRFAVVTALVVLALVVAGTVGLAWQRDHPAVPAPSSPSPSTTSEVPVIPLPPDPTPTVRQPALVAQFDGYTTTLDDVSPPRYHHAAVSLLVGINFGTLTLDANRCRVDGSAQGLMATGGAWTYNPGSLRVQCPGDQASRDVGYLLGALEGATTWRLSTYDATYATAVQGLPAGTYYTLSGGVATVYLRVPDAYRPDPLPLFGTLAPPPTSTVAGELTGADGQWAVTRLVVARFDMVITREPPLPFDVTIAGGRIVLPSGCDTPPGDGFLASSDGRWFFGSDPAPAAPGCGPNEANGAYEAEDVMAALLQGQTWTEVFTSTYTSDGATPTCTVEDVLEIRSAITSTTVQLTRLGPPRGDVGLDCAWSGVDSDGTIHDGMEVKSADGGGEMVVPANPTLPYASPEAAARAAQQAVEQAVVDAQAAAQQRVGVTVDGGDGSVVSVQETAGATAPG